MWVIPRRFGRRSIRVTAGFLDPILKVVVGLLAEAGKAYSKAVWILELESISAKVDRVA
jgi:hypothetical protein